MVTLTTRDDLIKEIGENRDEEDEDLEGAHSESNWEGESSDPGSDLEEPAEQYEQSDVGSDKNIKTTDQDVDTPSRQGCSALFTHLRVYAMADRYDVPALRMLARTRFKSEALIEYYKSPKWPSVVDELFSTTRENDDFIRQVPSKLTSAMMYDIAFKTLMRPVMQKHGDFAIRVMDSLLQGSAATN